MTGLASPIAVRRALLCLAAAVAGLATLAAPAAAAPPCAGSPPQVNTLLAGQGVLESVIVSDDGRLFFTANDALMRLDRPGGEPRLLTPVIEPGGCSISAKALRKCSGSLSHGISEFPAGPCSPTSLRRHAGPTDLFTSAERTNHGRDEKRHFLRSIPGNRG